MAKAKAGAHIKGAKSKDAGAAASASSQRIGLFFAVVGGISALIVAAWLARPSTSSTSGGSVAELDLEVVFANPRSTAEVVYLFDIPDPLRSQPRMLATLEKGGSTTQRTRAGHTFFFSTSKSADKRRHVVEVDPNLLRYEFNEKCKDFAKADVCSGFKSNGACLTHPGWMSTQCASSCNFCHLLDQRVRCDPKRLNISRVPVVESGDIERMFTSLQSRFPQYDVQIISREPQGPWIATLDNFITELESAALLSTTEKGMRRSTDQGEINAETGVQSQITSQKRTSTNAWCEQECTSHPAVKNLLRRMSEVVGVPQGNFEDPQVLRYQKGEYYQAHHDSTEVDLQMVAGYRIYTMFLYFDDVESGGETSFPKLNLTVAPARGKALLWPSVMNDDPSKMDTRTLHAAEPVIRGVKRSANVWVHQFNYKVPNLWGCTGAFENI